MAKAQFARNQRVWVESVGAWSVIERIVPVWAKGFDEPVRITYDVGFGREFLGHELLAEADSTGALLAETTTNWRVLRAKNKWQTAEDCRNHPFPGTFPVVVTDAEDWGGWRVPAAEYDRAPAGMEQQARLISQAPALLKLAQLLVKTVKDAPHDAPPALVALAREANRVMTVVAGDPRQGPSSTAIADEDPLRQAV